MVKINLLTYLTFELNMLVDNGYRMTLKEAKELCQRKKILVDLQERFPFKETNFDLSLLKKQPDVEVEIENALFEASGTEDSAFLVKNNGLCLLIGYIQELIQQEARKYGI